MVSVALLLSPSSAPAAVFNLRADATTITLPCGLKVGMWGFALDSDFNRGDGRITVPGPLLALPPGDNTITIRLRNNLTQARTGVPGGVIVSLVIPALPGKLSPVYWSARPYPQYAGRVRSLNTETPPGNAKAVVYTWTNVRPGAFLYHSGTQPQVQVQMGLYGAVKKDQSTRTAYPGIPYDQEAVLLYSEIDPGLHAAVVRGEYGPRRRVTSAIDYHPRYFLVNGAPATAAAPLLQDALRGRRLLLRLLNAGLQTCVPTLGGLSWDLVAEDGYPYPHPRRQYTALLAAGKSLDAILVPDALGRYPVYDHSTGGLLSDLRVANPTAAAPRAASSAYRIDKNTTLSVAAPGVLSGASDPAGLLLSARLVSAPAHGALSLNGDGSFTYIPNLNYVGADRFDILAANAQADSAPARVGIQISQVNAPPLTTPKHFTTARNTSLSPLPPAVLTGDADPEGGKLTAALAASPATGTLNRFASDGSFTYTPPAAFTGDVIFKYKAGDGAVWSPATPVTVKVAEANGAPVARADAWPVARNTALSTNKAGVLANDSDPDGDTLMAFLATAPANGVLKLNPDGSFSYTPNPGYSGKDSFDYSVSDGSLAARGRVTLTIQ